MLSIPSTLSLHRATRALYMDAARRARAVINLAVFENEFGNGAIPVFAKVYGTNKLYKIKKIPDPNLALRCFLRRARLTNWKLVAVKRFARQFETGKQNLLNSDDESVWGGL